MSEGDRIYFANRAKEEWQKAEGAADPKASAVHRAMSKAYLEKASIGDRAKQDPPELVG